MQLYISKPKFGSAAGLAIFFKWHPLMSRMHKPDPKLPPNAQDKRSVIPIEAGDVDAWLAGTVADV